MLQEIVFWKSHCFNRGLYGARQKDAEVSRIWLVNSDTSGRRYTINRSHELIQLLRARLGSAADLLDGIIDLIERTVPVERVWLDVTERGTPSERAEDDPELTNAAATMVALMKQAGIPFDTAVAKVAAMDPFDKVQDLPKKLTGRKLRGAAL
jgi:hypothetical protein